MEISIDTKLSRQELKKIILLTTEFKMEGKLDLTHILTKMVKHYLETTEEDLEFEDIFDSSDSPSSSWMITQKIDTDETETESMLSTGQAAKKVGVSSQTVLNWIESGKIEAIQTPGGHWRIPAHQFRTTEKQDEKFDKFLKRMWDKHKDLPPITDDDLEGT